MTRRPLLLAASLVASCSAPLPFQGNWVGTVVPKTPGPACASTRGSAQVHGDTLTFIPNEGTWILSGSISPTGRVTAERSTLGANKQPWETSLAAEVSGQTMAGTYVTPRCEFTISLTRI